MKKNFDLKTLSYLKTVPVALLIALAISACQTLHKNTVVMVKNNKVLIKDAETNDERLIDCTKKSNKHPNLQADLPYFHKEDPVEFKPAKGYTYDGFRAYFIDGSEFKYNPDTIQIRKDREKIAAFKADTTQHVR